MTLSPSIKLWKKSKIKNQKFCNKFILLNKYLQMNINFNKI